MGVENSFIFAVFDKHMKILSKRDRKLVGKRQQFQIRIQIQIFGNDTVPTKNV